MQSLLKVAIALLMPLVLGPSLASAGAADASAKCPAGSTGRNFDGLLICVPASNGRYVLIEDGIDWMAWQGDDPVARQSKDKAAGADELNMTLARAFIGEAIVGTSDSASGKNGFDRFMTLIATSILQGAESFASLDGFTAVVPVDESGLTQRFQFTQIQPDLLQGQRATEDENGVDFILYRPSSGKEQPHVLLCSGGKSVQSPTHICMSMRDMDGHRIGIMVTGTVLERSFRISEKIGADLETFVVRQAP
jgi:hypothetical protein